MILLKFLGQQVGYWPAARLNCFEVLVRKRCLASKPWSCSCQKGFIKVDRLPSGAVVKARLTLPLPLPLLLRSCKFIAAPSGRIHYFGFATPMRLNVDNVQPQSGWRKHPEIVGPRNANSKSLKKLHKPFKQQLVAMQHSPKTTHTAAATPTPTTASLVSISLHWGSWKGGCLPRTCCSHAAAHLKSRSERVFNFTQICGRGQAKRISYAAANKIWLRRRRWLQVAMPHNSREQHRNIDKKMKLN